MPRYLMPPSPLTDPSKVLSATSERGSAIRRGPQPDSGNVGTLKLTAEHTLPGVTASALEFDIEGGGNPDGYLPGGSTTASGARVRWRVSGDTSDETRAWVDRIFTRYLDVAVESGVSTANGKPSQLRQLTDGTCGFVVARSAASNTSLRFVYKSDRFSDWTSVTISDNSVDTLQLTSATNRPGLLVTDSGRLIAYAQIDSPYAGSSTDFIAAWYSDDSGATWSVLSQAAATFAGSCHAEWLGGAAVLVDAGGAVWTSNSDGVAFVQTGAASSYSNAYTVNMGNGSVLVFADDGGTTTDMFIASLAAGGSLESDSAWRQAGMGATFAEFMVVRDDVGDLFLVGIADESMASAELYASTDGGASWVDALPDGGYRLFGLSNGTLSPAQTVEGLAGGMMGADLVVLGTSAVSTSGTSGNDGNIIAIYLGGWDVDVSEETFGGELAGGPYEYHAMPITLPENTGWTRNDTSAGATATIANGGLRIVSSAGGNSEWTAPASWTSGGSSGLRARFVVQVASGGSVITERSRIKFQKGNATDGVWFVLRFSSTQIRAADSSGALATDTPFPSLNQPIEFIVIFDADPGASGTATVLYRFQSQGVDGEWTVLMANQTIANDASAANDEITFGGTNPGAVDWYVRWFALSEDNTGINKGTGARGRALSNQSPMYIYGGVSVGAYGTSGIAGDSYTLTQVAAWPKEAVWGADSPSEQCQSTTDTSLWRIVFDMGANNEMWGDIVAAFGTNVAEFKVMANATDSWGSPARSVTVDTSIRSDSLDGTGPGWAALDTTDEMVPHEFASKAGKRYMVSFSGTGNAYEITDNTATTLICRDQDLSSETGTATIYMNAGWGSINLDEMRYLAFEVAANEPNPDGYFSLGQLVASEKVSMNVGDGSDAAFGWQRGTRIPVQVEEAEDGYQTATVIGGPQETLLLPMVESVQELRDWSHEVSALLRYLDGPGSLVALVLDSTESSFHRNGGLYRVQGTTVSETHVYGNATDTTQRWRAPAISLREVT